MDTRHALYIEPTRDEGRQEATGFRMNVFSRTCKVFLTATILGALCGCMAGGVDGLRQSGGNAALFGQFAAFDGPSGRAITLDDVVARAGRADVVLFGEEHSDVVCNAIEAQLLAALARQPRPVTLAMEFFEADTQTALDAYLNGRISESEFRKETRQKRAYSTSHRPMIEFCRSASIPVIAANAPWRLTRALRKSGKAYEEFLAGLDSADRAWLPDRSELLEGPYHDRFVEAMAEHEMPPTSQPTTTSAPAESQPASQPTSQPDRAEQVLRAYRAQSLWDDTMSDAVARHRRCYPNRRVLLVVGAFHIAKEGGTWTKLRQRRPGDRILTIVFRGTSDVPFTFSKEDQQAGDIVICGIRPPEEDSATSKPSSR